MKTLKLGIFSLLAIFAVSIFLTSCEQQEIAIEDVNNTPDFEISYNSTEGNTKIMLPEHITEKGQEAVVEYLESISDEQKVKHINDYIINNYLTQKGVLQDVELQPNQMMSYQDLDLSEHLSDEELKYLNENLVDIENLQIDSRHWCCYDVYEYSYSYWSWYCGCWVDVYDYAYTVCYWC